MTISVVQTATANNAYSGNFGSNVTAGNSVIMVVTGYNGSSGSTITFSAPTLGGSSVTGATKIISTFGSTDAISVWLLPNVTGGATSFGITVTNSPTASYVGIIAWEVNGLGATPTLDRTSSGSGTGAGNQTSGTTAAITQAPEFIAGGIVQDGAAGSLPASPWTNTTLPGNSGDNSFAGYQIVTSSGGTYVYNATSGNADWGAVIATVYGAGGSPQSVSLTAPNLALAAPLVSVSAGASVALTAPNLALAAPLLSPKAGAVTALTAPNVALAAPLVSPSAGATVALTAPNVALTAPVPSVSAGATVALTAPNLALAAPLVSPSAGGSPQSVSLTAPNLALAAPVVSPSAGAVITLTAPNLALAAPVVTPVAGVAVALTAPGIALTAPVLAVTAGGRVTLTAPGITLAAPLLGLGSPQQGTAAITLAASTATIRNALTGSVTIVNDL